MRVRGLWVAVAVAGTVAGGLLFACGLDSGGSYAGGVDASIDQTTRDAPLADNYVAPDAPDDNPGIPDGGDAALEAGCNESTCTGTCCGNTCTLGVYGCTNCNGLPYFCQLANGPAGFCVSNCSTGCGPNVPEVYDGGCIDTCESANAFKCVTGGNCVNRCDDCDAAPFGCTFCSDGGSPVQAQCEPNASNCPDQAVQPGSVCLCPSGDAGECYGALQVCAPIGGPPFGGATACLTCGQSGNGGPDTKNQGCKGGGTCQTAPSPPVCQ